MKNLVILGAGTAGTTVANLLRKKLPADWSLKIIDPETEHLFQPDLIFIPFDMQKPEKTYRPRKNTLGRGVEWLQRQVQLVEPDNNQVILEDGEKVPYDILVLATGSHIRPDETPGLLGDEWQKSIFDFYTLEGATKLRDALREFEGGRIAINIVEMPIKCPVAPLEITFLAESYFSQKGMRDAVELTYVTPLDGAFTKPIASKALGSMLDDRGIKVEAEFNTGEVDAARKVLRSYDEREVPFDLLITIPTHMGAQFIEDSGLGDELAFVPTDDHTLKADNHDNIFVLGDATNLPTSKAGSVAHFQAEVLVDNILHAIKGESLKACFDGHANCFIESGYGRAMLIDFNYDQEPLPGVYPLPTVGPFPLLKESRFNHWGKMMFRYVYWHALLPGRPMPVPIHMSMAGKKRPAQLAGADTELVS
jgi:sulfide:quinone oxidoreductase